MDGDERVDTTKNIKNEYLCVVCGIMLMALE